MGELRDQNVTPEERRLLVGDRSAPDRSPRQRAEKRLDRHRRIRRRRWRLLWVGVLVATAGMLLVALWLLRTRVPESFPPRDRAVLLDERVPLRSVRLFYPAIDGRGLREEVRLLPRQGDRDAAIVAVIETLLAGPLTSARSPWPPETSVQEVFLSESGTVYVNLGSSLRWLMPDGDYLEWSAVATLTRTLCANFPEIQGVRILLDGEGNGLLGRVIPLDRTYRAAMFMEEE